ncbi:hypothetical protein TYRP_018275 [Tyrophagus putrescentiae]|nr:hypothetical protein TYRP_020684 [Tyrophagus putrescentiae]KAH9398890.1 hypothetical protein TYRP_018275 [Tyrophagus putrescentiae]
METPISTEYPFREGAPLSGKNAECSAKAKKRALGVEVVEIATRSGALSHETQVVPQDVGRHRSLPCWSNDRLYVGSSRCLVEHGGSAEGDADEVVCLLLTLSLDFS